MKIEREYGRPWYRVQNAPSRVVNYLKYSVMNTHRFWDPDKEAWMVHEKYIEDVQSLGATESVTTTPSTSDDYAILYLRTGAPMAIVKAAWRALAKLHHPDVGGDPEQFKRYKDAYERLTKDGGDG